MVDKNVTVFRRILLLLIINIELIMVKRCVIDITDKLKIFHNRELT